MLIVLISNNYTIYKTQFTTVHSKNWCWYLYKIDYSKRNKIKLFLN